MIFNDFQTFSYTFNDFTTILNHFYLFAMIFNLSVVFSMIFIQFQHFCNDFTYVLCFFVVLICFLQFSCCSRFLQKKQDVFQKIIPSSKWNSELPIRCHSAVVPARSARSAQSFRRRSGSFRSFR